MKNFIKYIFAGIPVFATSVVGIGVIAIILIYVVGMYIYNYNWIWGFPIIAFFIAFCIITIILLGKEVIRNQE